MLSFIVGLATMTVGIWGIVHWRSDVMIFLKGFLSVSFLMGGLVTLIIGMYGIKDVLAKKKPSPESGHR
jgi:hypothetical protein